MFPIRGGVYWASSANPCHGTYSFAVAGSNGTSLLIDRQGDWGLEGKRWDRETVALDWLSPNVVIKACRFGSVRLWDTRNFAENAAPRIQHPANITHVRRIDENMIAVAGIQHTVREAPTIQCAAKLTVQLRTYDLRYTKPNRSAQCYDRFPTYRNNLLTHQPTGLDVHQNLLAAATDDGRVQLFDVKKGVELSSGISARFGNYTCVRFVDEQRSGEALKLMVATGPMIEWWSFGDSTVKSLTTKRDSLTKIEIARLWPLYSPVNRVLEETEYY